MDRDDVILNEQIKYDHFNRSIEEEYKKKFLQNNNVDEYFDDTTFVASNNKSENKNTQIKEKSKKEKLFLYKIISPVIDLGKHFYSSLTLIYEPKLYHLSLFLTLLWGYKNIKYINKLLVHKYNDIHYQITRPDSLNSRHKAFKVLAIGGSIIPCSVIALSIYDMKKEKNNSMFIKNIESTFSQRDTNPLMPYTVKRNFSKKVQCLKERLLFFAKDLAENNNFKKLSKEYHTNINKRLNSHYFKKDKMS
ncbi:conserved protein, unknown function [Plasmodium yoelii]|uniref:Uncharacterized protein n=1 Tax=Plasmodium yoelii TaxID=5861 RepID=A0A077Y9X0_PLAYE|nr:conserved protein, unknown function [Plasmodium yoelii]CDU18839.1 conserved Plasmodium protein, unknown function [Plasmodium yoelii]VTZ79424.1 conserved protein, unknown function [Plasmodium yoelii]|eukprot:XP_022812380.1 conserved protein, unknown function [Plasmodium yoelii]